MPSVVGIGEVGQAETLLDCLGPAGQGESEKERVGTWHCDLIDDDAAAFRVDEGAVHHVPDGRIECHQARE